MRHSRRATRSVAGLTALGLAVSGLGVVAAPAAVAAEPGDVFISEIHYDNVGTDVGEAIEIEAAVTTDVAGWSLVLYNGANGSVYDTTALSGTLEAGEVAVTEYPANGIQNGSPDAMALVDADGEVMELLSYEGTFTAVGGPADGQVTVDIGVEETGSTPIGHSLQRVDGTWVAPGPNTFGVRNGSDPDPDPEPQPEEDTHTISEIQGTGASTELDGQTVTTSGLVTAVYPEGGFDGYYLQTPGTGGDEDLATRTASDAIFVYSPATVDDVAVGDHVRVTGTAGEYFTLTQVSVPTASGAQVLDESAEPVVAVPFELPRAEGRREVFEGMLVRPADGYVVSDTYSLGGFGTNAFGSIGLGYGGPLVQETDVASSGTPEYDALVEDNAARAITLDDGRSARTTSSQEVPYLTADSGVRTGAELTFVGDVVLDYRFQWNFQPTTPVSGAAPELVTFDGGNTRAANAEPEDVGGDLTVASFNVLNYFTELGEDEPGCPAYTDRDGRPLTANFCDVRGAYTPEALASQEGKIVTAINGLDADVVALAEIENSAKFGKDPDDALATLTAALNADAGAGTWDYVRTPEAMPPLADQDVIRNAFIYRPAAVSVDGPAEVLIGDPAFSNAREPLVQAFAATEGDYRFVAAANHFKSKGGSCDPEPAEGCFDEDRTAQAQALVDFTDEVAAEAGVADAFLLGDFNSYGAEDPLLAIEAAGYTNLNPGEPNYVFDGKVGSLDHVFANGSAAERVTGADVWRINAPESVLAEYSRENYFASEIFQEGTPFRSSDHDPLLVGIDTGADGAPGEDTVVDVLSINDFHGRLEADREAAGAAVLAGAVDAVRAENPNTLFTSAGDNIGASTFVSFIADDTPTLEALNLMGLDVSATGNHEFDKGQDDLLGRVTEQSDFPYVAANVVDEETGEPVFEPYQLSEVGGVTVATIGALTTEMPTLVSPAGIEGLAFPEPGPIVNEIAAELKESGTADVVVVSAHDGAGSGDLEDALDTDTTFGRMVAQAAPAIDAVFSGHTHQTYAHEVTVAGRETALPVVQAAQYGEAIGRVTLEVDGETGAVTAAEPEIVDLVVDGVAQFPADPEVAELVADAVEQAEELGAVSLGEITTDLRRAQQSDGAENRGGESTLGNLVADVQLSATEETGGAQIALMNPGGLRADLTFAGSGEGDPDGNVTFAEAAAVQPFANTLVTMDLTGAQLAQVLEEQWGDGARDFLKLGVSTGFSYTYDPSAPDGAHITSMTLEGEPVQPTGTYRVAVNSFLASGGDGFATLAQGTAVADSGQVDLDAFVAYMAEFSPVAPDLAQRSVGLTWVSDAETVYTAGDEIAIDASSLLFSAGEPQDDVVQLDLAGVDVGTAAVDPAVVDGTDETGRAAIRVEVPEQAVPAEGTETVELTLTLPETGTVVAVPVQLGGGDSGPGGYDDAVELVDQLTADGLLDRSTSRRLIAALASAERFAERGVSGSLERALDRVEDLAGAVGDDDARQQLEEMVAELRALGTID